MNTSHQKLITLPRAVFAAGALALVGVFAGLHAAPSTSKAPVAVKRDSEPVNRGQLESASFSGVVKRVAPSVVKITTQTKARRVAANVQDFPGLDNPAFRQFFGGRMPQIEQAPQSGLGSGVIISADGYIATNNHVVQGADQLTVTLVDGREFTAKVIGRDPQTDIAVIKVDAKDLPAITFADSGKIEVGDRVLAIGNPFGIGETVTTGIVSAMGRRPGLGLAYEDFIQTDAAINPGNSGGALVDVQGRLIGINTAILSRTGGFQGVGLAVPANLVGHVADNLVQNGKVVRGYLGVGAQDITPSLAESLELKSRAGALVSDVQPDSPAAKAGLKSGDVITAVNGQKVEDANKLTFTISAAAPGTKLELDILRDGKTEHVKVTAAERPKNLAKNGGGRGRDQSQGDEDLAATTDEGVLNGVAVGDLDRDTRRSMNLPARLQGAVITDVAADSAAARSGLRAGDVILEINKQSVTNAQEAVELSAKAEGKKTLLKLWSRGSTVFVVVDESSTDKTAS